MADLGVLAALIRTDKLDTQAGWDYAWALDDKALPLQTAATPRTMETQVGISGGGIASGGVSFGFAAVAAQREKDAALDALPAKALKR